MNKAELDAATASMTKSLIEFGEFKEASIVLEAAKNYAELLPHLEALKGEEGGLLHCPFCRKENPYVKKVWRSDYYPNGASFYHVECSRGRCGARGPSRKSNRERAIKDWNTRPSLIDEMVGE
jgi:hypothetical protein